MVKRTSKLDLMNLTKSNIEFNHLDSDTHIEIAWVRYNTNMTLLHNEFTRVVSSL